MTLANDFKSDYQKMMSNITVDDKMRERIISNVNSSIAKKKKQKRTRKMLIATITPIAAICLLMFFVITIFDLSNSKKDTTEMAVAGAAEVDEVSEDTFAAPENGGANFEDHDRGDVPSTDVDSSDDYEADDACEEEAAECPSEEIDEETDGSVSLIPETTDQDYIYIFTCYQSPCNLNSHDFCINYDQNVINDFMNFIETTIITGNVIDGNEVSREKGECSVNICYQGTIHELTVGEGYAFYDGQCYELDENVNYCEIVASYFDC